MKSIKFTFFNGSLESYILQNHQNRGAMNQKQKGLTLYPNCNFFIGDGKRSEYKSLKLQPPG